VARAFRDKLGLDRLYVADLDAILGERPNFDVYAKLAGEGFALLIDAGLRDEQAAGPVLETGAEAVVAGLETLAGPAALEGLCGQLGPQRVVFSLDMKEGKSLGDLNAWGSVDPREIATRAVECGMERMIVLDLSQVGVEQGVSTFELCSFVRSKHPAIELTTGGGVRGPEDLAALASAGIDGVLIASALHSGAIGRNELREMVCVDTDRKVG
jgi:phosphoribosylformimino-5-aminoimidazole carboxamide ribotide isomerase